MRSRVKKYNGAAVISAAILYYLIPPYFFWNNFFSDIYVKTIFAFILFGLFYKNRYRWTPKDSVLIILLLIALVIYTFSGGNNFNYLVGSIPILFLPFAKDKFSKEVYLCFLDIYVIIIAISLVSWLLAILGVISPITTIRPLNTFKSSLYNVYPLLVIEQGIPFERFYGPFDEPGVVGTLSGILLCIEKFNIKSTKTIIILISGLCSLSFFFSILIVVYYLVYFVFIRKSIGLSFVFILMAGAIFYLTQTNPILYDAIGYRFEWNASTNRFEGDNRINYEVADYYLNKQGGTSELWWGIREREAFLNDIGEQSSFYSIIIVNGLIFTIIYFTYIVLYGLRFREKWMDFLLYLLVVVGVLYQRPWVFYPSYIFLFAYLARKENIEAHSYTTNNKT